MALQIGIDKLQVVQIPNLFKKNTKTQSLTLQILEISVGQPSKALLSDGFCTISAELIDEANVMALNQQYYNLSNLVLVKIETKNINIYQQSDESPIEIAKMEIISDKLDQIGSPVPLQKYVSINSNQLLAIHKNLNCTTVQELERSPHKQNTHIQHPILLNLIRNPSANYNQTFLKFKDIVDSNIQVLIFSEEINKLDFYLQEGKWYIIFKPLLRKNPKKQSQIEFKFDRIASIQEIVFKDTMIEDNQSCSQIGKVVVKDFHSQSQQSSSYFGSQNQQSQKYQLDNDLKRLWQKPIKQFNESPQKIKQVSNKIDPNCNQIIKVKATSEGIKNNFNKQKQQKKSCLNPLKQFTGNLDRQTFSGLHFTVCIISMKPLGTKGIQLQVIDRNQNRFRLILWKDQQYNLNIGETYIFDNLRFNFQKNQLCSQNYRGKQTKYQISEEKIIAQKASNNHLNKPQVISLRQLLQNKKSPDNYYLVRGYINIITHLSNNNRYEHKHFFYSNCKQCKQQKFKPFIDYFEEEQALICKGCQNREPEIIWNIKCYLIDEEDKLPCRINSDTVDKVLGVKAHQAFQLYAKNRHKFVDLLNKLLMISGTFKLKIRYDKKGEKHYNIYQYYSVDKDCNLENSIKRNKSSKQAIKNQQQRESFKKSVQQHKKFIQQFEETQLKTKDEQIKSIFNRIEEKSMKRIFKNYQKEEIWNAKQFISKALTSKSQLNVEVLSKFDIHDLL